MSGYSLSVTDSNSGLTSNGLAITLTKVGNDIVGSTTDGEVFRISVASNGTVTLTGSRRSWTICRRTWTTATTTTSSAWPMARCC